jgi:hypothetical protein
MCTSELVQHHTGERIIYFNSIRACGNEIHSLTFVAGDAHVDRHNVENCTSMSAQSGKYCASALKILSSARRVAKTRVHFITARGPHDGVGLESAGRNGDCQPAGITLERQRSGRHLIKHSSKRKQITPSIKFFARRLLGGHVSDSAHRAARSRELLRGIESRAAQRIAS